MSPPLCVCGCGTALTPYQVARKYRFASLTCSRKSRRRPDRVCAWEPCGTSYHPSYRGQRFCSLSCGAQARVDRDPEAHREAVKKAWRGSYEAYAQRVKGQVLALVPKQRTFTYAEVVRLLISVRKTFIEHGYQVGWATRKKRGGRAA